MYVRACSLARWTLLALFAFALVGACGRSNLDDYLPSDAGPGFEGGPHPDGGPDSDAFVPCGVSTCPNGCCDSSGTCRPGGDLADCGSFGRQCADCRALGFTLCDARTHACANNTTQCGPQNCGGCCEGNLCFGGTDPNECGFNGRACQHCVGQGLACQGGQCRPGACGPQNCKGCCFGDQCVGGSDQTACGNFGKQCQNCTAQGETCVITPAGGVCQVTPCGPQNCKGCCANGTCVGGVGQNACGQLGQQCQNCTALGEQCVPAPPVGGLCVGVATCSPQTCPGGCCVGNACFPGTGNAQCGVGGNACQNCQAIGDTCQGQKCVPPQLCGPQNCGGGCCSGDVCAVGTQDGACGGAGQACQNCTGINEICVNQRCVIKPPPVCTPQNCPGCCDPAGVCEPGFLDTACGQGGATCANCSATQTTCNTNANPRVCTTVTTQCPQPYPACPPSVTVTPLPQQKVCSTLELANAAAACTGGATTPSCQAYFQFEQQTNPPCATCLAPFHVDFNQLNGIFECVAPFVDSTCDHNLGCISDCETQSCAQCDPSAVQSCENQVRQTQCQPYFQQAQCVFPAFQGQGAFCSPNTYGGNYGQWLQGVGAFYCGQ